MIENTTISESTQPSIGVHAITTLVTDEFMALANRLGPSGMTPEMLLSYAARLLVESPPKVFGVFSASPINGQDCKSCPLASKCSSMLRRAREKLLCFEKLPVVLALIAGLLLGKIGTVVVESRSPSVAAQAAQTAGGATPPPLCESVTLPDGVDTYLRPKLRAKFAKRRKRMKRASRNDNPVMMALNNFVRAGYENARR